MVKELQRAIDQEQQIQIIYLGSNGQTTQRTFRPLKINGDSLKAYCLTRRAPRVFVIGNILAVELMVNGRAMIAAGDWGLEQLMVEYERSIIQRYLTAGKKGQDNAATVSNLQISLSTLYRKMEKYGLVGHSHNLS